MDIQQYVDELAKEALRDGPLTPLGEPSESLQCVLKGNAVELWSTAAGRLFLVADEADAREALKRFGLRRGEIYTGIEATRIIALKDAAAAAEIHDWKRRFDGVVQEARREDGRK